LGFSEREVLILFLFYFIFYFYFYFYFLFFVAFPGREVAEDFFLG